MQEENFQSDKQDELREQSEYQKRIAEEHGFEKTAPNGLSKEIEDKEKVEQSEENPEVAKAASSEKTDSKNTTMAFIAYVFFAIPLLTDSKDDPFVKYHVKQSLGLLIAWVVISLFTAVPLFGWVFGPILGIILVFFWILGIINALEGKQKPLPLIGEQADKLNF